MDLFIHFAGLAACTFVLAGCVCRIDQMRSGRQGWDWFALYALFAVFAFGLLLSQLRGHPLDWGTAAGISGVALHMALTRHLWRDGPPPETTRGDLVELKEPRE